MGAWSCEVLSTHGVQGVVFSDAEMFLRMEAWHFGMAGDSRIPRGRGREMPTAVRHLRLAHQPHSLANVDLTSRCNLSCQVCLPTPTAAYELSFEQAMTPAAAPASARRRPLRQSRRGTTLHPRFLEIGRRAKRWVFSISRCQQRAEVADPGFRVRARKRAFSTCTQMDGRTDEVLLRSAALRSWIGKACVLESAGGRPWSHLGPPCQGGERHQLATCFDWVRAPRCALRHRLQPMTFTRVRKGPTAPAFHTLGSGGAFGEHGITRWRRLVPADRRWGFIAAQSGTPGLTARPRWSPHCRHAIAADERCCCVRVRTDGRCRSHDFWILYSLSSDLGPGGRRTQAHA